MKQRCTSPDEAGEKDVFEVAARVDNCMHIYVMVGNAIYEPPGSYYQFTIDRNAVQGQ